jgi:RND family efflux transporter MFP subunit
MAQEISDPRKRPLFRSGPPANPPAPVRPATTSLSNVARAAPTTSNPDDSFLKGPVQPANSAAQAAPPAPARPATPARNPAPANMPQPPRTESSPVINSTLYWWLGLIAGLLIVAALVHHFWTKPAAAASGDGATASSAHGGHHGAHGGAGETIRVVVATAAKGDIGVYLTGLGSVTALYTDTVQSRVNGQLMKVLFTEGQMVKAGDLLVADRQPPLRVAACAIRRAKGARSSPARQCEHRFAAVRDALAAGLDSAAATGHAGQSLVKQDQGTVDGDQALIDATKLNITYCNITAPISGRVGLRLVDPGNYVQSTSATGLLVITQVQPITVVFTIPEDSVQPVLRQAATAARACRWRPMIARTRTNWPTGRSLTTDNQIDPSTGTLKLKAIFANANNELFPNQFVNTRLLVDMKKDVTLVPVPAIQYGTQGTFRLSCRYRSQRRSVAPKTTVHLVNVTIGTADGGNVEVVKGLAPGQIVVTDGVDKLQDGSKVIVQTNGWQTSRAARSLRPRGRSRRERKLDYFGKELMSPSRTFILRPVATTLLMAAILLAGIAGYTQLPVSALPEVDYPTMQVVTFYPGASPSVMASSVTAPLERQFGQVPGLQQMTSTSSDGSSVIVLQFALSLNIDVAEQEVQQAINASQSYLPTDLPNPPIYSKTNPADAPDPDPRAHLENHAAVEGRRPGRHAPGPKNFPGHRRRSGQHQRRPETGRPHPGQSHRALILRLNLEDIRTAISGASVQPGQGQLRRPEPGLPDRGERPALSSDGYASLVVAYRNGAPVRLSDVAT